MITKIYHPHFSETGKLCQYCHLNSWSPAITIAKVLRWVIDWMKTPEIGLIDPHNFEAAQLLRTDKKAFEAKAKEWCQKYA